MSRQMPWPKLNPETTSRSDLVEWERQIAGLHRQDVPKAKRRIASPALPVDEPGIRRELSRSMGIDELVSRLGSSSTPPVAPEPEPVDRLEVLSHSRAEALAGVSRWNVAARWGTEPAILVTAEETVARLRSEREAERKRVQAQLDEDWTRLKGLQAQLEDRVVVEVEAGRQRRLEERDAEQAALDAQWEKLIDNEPVAVKASIESLGGVGVPFELVKVEGKSIAALVSVGPVEWVVPERCPSMTPGGKPTTKKRTKTERNETYLAVLCAMTLNVAWQVFNSSPGAERLTVAIRPGGERGQALMVTEFDRDQFREREPARTRDPRAELDEAVSFTCETRGRTREVVAHDWSV